MQVFQRSQRFFRGPNQLQPIVVAVLELAGVEESNLAQVLTKIKATGRLEFNGRLKLTLRDARQADVLIEHLVGRQRTDDTPALERSSRQKLAAGLDHHRLTLSPFDRQARR